MDVGENEHGQNRQKSIKQVREERDNHMKVVTSISAHFKAMALHAEPKAIMLIHDSSTSKENNTSISR